MKSSVLYASVVLSAAISVTSLAASPATYAASRTSTSTSVDQQKTVTSYSAMNFVVEAKKNLMTSSTDTIRVYGQPFSPGAPYYEKFLMTITSGSTGAITFIPLAGGYKPTISFPFLTNSSTPDIFVDSPTGGNGILSTDYLFAYRKGNFVGFSMPSAPVIRTKWLNNYRIQFQIPSLKKTVVLSIVDKKSAYDKAGIYHNGQLVKAFRPMVIPIGYFKPIVQRNHKALLQGVQEISGLYHADGIANVFWNWKWTSQGWRLIGAAIRK